MLVTFEIAELAKIFLRYRLHAFETFFLHVVRKFEIVDSDTVLAVGRNRTVGRIKPFGKETLHLFDASFMRSLFFHHFK